MHFLGRLFRWIGFVLLAMGAVGLVGLVTTTFLEDGFGALQDLMNLSYFMVALVLLCPGAVLVLLGDKLINQARKAQ